MGGVSGVGSEGVGGVKGMALMVLRRKRCRWRWCLCWRRGGRRGEARGMWSVMVDEGKEVGGVVSGWR